MIHSINTAPTPQHKLTAETVKPFNTTKLLQYQSANSKAINKSTNHRDKNNKNYSKDNQLTSCFLPKFKRSITIFT